jgi:hypothetical protein
MDPWSDRLHLIKPSPQDIFNARDKMPFEITPFEIHLTREDKATANATPAAAAPAAAETQAAAPVAHP